MPRSSPNQRRGATGQDRTRSARHHDGRAAAPHRRDRPGRTGVAGAGGDVELHVSARDARRNEISRFLRERAADFDGFAAAVRAETSRMDRQPRRERAAAVGQPRIPANAVEDHGERRRHLESARLGLAAIGVYGVVAYVVSRRRREVGVRMALGADARDVQRLILRQTLRPVAVGMIIGVAVAAVTARLLHSALFGVSPYDPVAFIGAPLLMLAIAAAAALLPTRRAMRINPMSVLRSE